MKMKEEIFALIMLCSLFNCHFLKGQCNCTDQGSFGLFNPLLICENFESYTNGANFPVNNTRWLFLPGTSAFGKIQTAPKSTSKALFISGSANAVPNLLLKLGNKTSGRYRVSWQMYVPKGKTANYKFQHAEDASSYAFEVAFGANGIGTVNRLQQTSSRFLFFIGAWNKVTHIVDLDTDQIELWINDEYVDSWKFSCGVSPDYNYCFFKVLSAVNFYGAPNSEFYVDDICMWQAVSNPVISFFRVCLKNGQSYEGGASVATTNGLYTSNEFAEEDCPDVCSFAGLNIKNSLKYSNGTKIPVSKITNESILPNAIINIPCLKNFFAFEATHKQFRGQVYPFTATTSSLYVDLIFQTGTAGNVEIALVECTGNQNYSCVTDPKTDGTSHFFTVQPGKNYIIILVAIREVEFLIDISTEDLPKECYEIIRPKSYEPSCICREFEKALSTSTTLVNVKTGVLSLSPRVFQEASQDYLGGEKAYRIILDQPGLVDLTISSTNQGYALFLAGSECDNNLLALAEIPANGGSASISKYLEAGVYHVIIDQLKLDNNSSFQLVYTASGVGALSRAPSLVCPVNQNSIHQVTIRSNPLLLDGEVLTISDRIYLLNPRNKANRESNAANWNGQELNFMLYGDATADNQECGYTEGELIEFAIVRQDKIYFVRPIFQFENGLDITGSDRFKKGGKSLISGFVSKLNVSNLGVGSIPALNANEKSFFVEVNSNENWRIERINPSRASWIEFNPSSGTGIKDVSFKAFKNSSTLTRTDTVLLINDQGFYKSIVITQPGCTGPSVNAGQDQSICAGQNVNLTATGIGTITWENPGTISNPLLSTTLNATQTFTAYATINGCSATDQVTVNVSPKPNANAGPDQTICSGSKALLSGSGGGAYTWSTGSTTAQFEVSPTATTTYTLTVTTQSGCTATDQVVVVVNRATASAGADRSICRGDSTNLQASGGGAYLWSNGKTSPFIKVSPISDQIYQVTVSNNNCTATASVKVTVNPLPLANAGADTSVCAGQSAMLTASGGSTYKWSNNAKLSSIIVTPASTETFTVTVTAPNGCEATDQLTVTVRPLPIANAGPDLSICAKQSAVLNASGGNTYKWSNNATTSSITISPQATQVFTVTVTQNECEAIDEVRVTVRPLPNANAGPDQNICAGQNTVLNASGGGTYKWSTNATTSTISVSPAATQIYTLTVTQNDCESIDQVNITVNPNPSIKKDSSQFKAGLKSFIAVSVTGGKDPYQYQWFRNDTLVSTQEDLIGLKTGVYKLSIQDANGCSVGFGPELFIITSTRDAAGLLDLKIYPNPTQGQVRIEGRFSKKETVQVRILDATGKHIWRSNMKTANEFLYTPDLSNLAKGIYIIQLDVSGELVYRKFILH